MYLKIQWFIIIFPFPINDSVFFFGGHTSVSDTAKTLELFINTYDVPYQDISSHVRERAKGQWVYWYGISARVYGRHGWRICSFQAVRWYLLPGWWFQTMEFYVQFHIWDVIRNPLTNSYFSRWLLHHQPASYVQVSKVFSASAGWGFPWFPLSPIHLWGISGALNVTEKMEVIFMGSGSAFVRNGCCTVKFWPIPIQFESNLAIWQFNSRPNLNQSSVVTVFLLGDVPTSMWKKPWEKHGKRTRIHSGWWPRMTQEPENQTVRR